ncbi:Macrolide export ATP-binding/permease protein MacB [Streptococcus parauberis]|uniref:ABC transporter ATP-binding protein/permease n=1 Tax=Streptococcus parauberis TaxID=1348 RepID=UPI000976F145|nr:ABC transporter ATP-binding protein/permease [Streptococcus parauberis]ONH64564.1 Macrolide export ATP-binding/permease protein MacB [Streptococcus parauberis]PCH12887.1 Macrolide export ATP-binding/permease protein MacB [Streptococcus parauberis]
MLTLSHITKIYQTGSLTQKALDDINLSFRSNEFVSILGQSGSGKTTLLNIIGGLDQYTSGDLQINGKSTKQFKDRNWDSYRNHSVGFVFQSYNLIPHQTALSNVQLALTLSGISKKESRQKALKALEMVGLKDHVDKRPSQMSGGQMQRIAIARALVNDPEILLADEPTGALDSETSVQIMELLKNIAQDRLVIMVTHNPDLAKKYSTRIVKVKDGHILSDSNPYDASLDQQGDSAKAPKTKMSFLTALSLSLNNLMTKKGRTILTAFAGSIGIIGIALILSLSNGVQDYIGKMQEDILTSYPLEITQTSSNLSALLDKQTNKKNKDLSKVYEDNQLSEMLKSDVQNNDLTSFKSYIEKHPSHYKKNTNAIQYAYPITLQLYKTDTTDGAQAVSPSPLDVLFDQSQSPMAKQSPMAQSSLFSTNVWKEMIDNRNLLKSQYQVLKGHLPKSANEVVIMVDQDNQLNDFALYALGLKSQAELDKLVNKEKESKAKSGDTKASAKKSTKTSKTYSFNDLMALEFKAVLPSAFYQKKDDQWVDIKDNATAMKDLITKAQTIKVVGIIKPKADAKGIANQSGIGYTKDLTAEIIDDNNQSQIIQEQVAQKGTNVFTKKAFITDPKKQVFSAEQLSDEEKLQLSQMSPEELTDYMNRMSENASATYKDNLSKLGYVELDKPSTIKFYPKSFKTKDDLKDLIQSYNSKVKKDKDYDKVLNYTDSVGLIMSSVTSIVTMITYVLIAFVAISLVVSSIMIGIITYISVLERTKEIGILRAMGASKRDVSHVFNAETVIEGIFAGVLGIALTLLLNIPINMIVKHLTGVSKITALPWQAAIILILISTILTLIAGIFPSRMAAKKDPVEALRTE